MARAIPGRQSTRHCRADHGLDVTQDRSWKPKVPVRGRRMSTIMEVDRAFPPATDGAIAATNLDSARRRAWARFAQGPRVPGVVEAVLDSERLAAQFLGNLDALNRLDELGSQFARVDDSFRAALVQAEVASTVHRFADAREHLA